jgi:sugar lactone lactonase YvrE
MRRRPRTLLALEQLENRVMPSVLIPVANRRDLVFDPTRNILDITTASGQVQRYDVANQTLLSPWSVGTSLNGADITSDGSALYVAENQTSGSHGILHRVDLADGSVSNLTYNLVGLEGGVWDVAIANNGKAFFSTRFNGSGWVPFRQVDLATGTVSIRTDTPGSGGSGQVRQDTHINRSADGSQMFMTESNISSGPIFTYAAASDSFPQHAQTGGFYDNVPSAVSRDGALIAIEMGGTVSITDRDLQPVRFLHGNFNGGLTFDPSRDVLYAVDGDAGKVVAFDTNTWAEKFQLNIGETIQGWGHFDTGEMTVSSDGSELFLSTRSGVRMIDLPASTGVANRLVVSGFATFILSGTIGNYTVTALDPAGNVADGFTGIVHFSSTDAQALLRQDYTFTPSDHGVHTFSAVLLSAGTFALTATDDADGLTGSETNIQVHTAPTSVIPVTNRRDLVYDGDRGMLFITTSEGLVQRYDVAHQTLLAPWQVGVSLYGADITLDGRYLYTGEGLRTGGHGNLYKVNLDDGTVTNLPYNLAGGEGGTWEVIIPNNGKALFDSHSGFVPIHELDLASGAISSRVTVRQDTRIERGADRSQLFLTEPGGPILGYDAASDTFSATVNIASSLSNVLSAVSRDGALIAIELDGAVSILDRNFHVVRILGGSLNGGLAFDPSRDLLYGVDAAARQVVAFDTNTWAEKFRLNVGENISAAVAFGNGEMTVSSDGRELFLSTPSGVRILDLPASTGVASRLVVSGFPMFLPSAADGSFSVTALDPAGNVAAGFAGTVHFSSTDANALLPPDYTFTAGDHGLHTFSATLVSGGTFSLTATDAAHGLGGSETNIQVHVGLASLIPVANRRDLVYDSSRGILYITTADGLVQRYDVAAQTLLAPWQVGASLYGADITPDGQYLYAAEGLRGATQGVLYKVNLDYGTVTDLTYNLVLGEGATWEVIIANNGKALFDSHSGTGPLHELDVPTGTISNLQTVNQDTRIERSADRSLLYLTEVSGQLITYDSPSDALGATVNSGQSLSNAPSAVSRDGGLIATEFGTTVSIMDRNFRLIRILGGDFNGGLAFDPNRDLLYAVNTADRAVVAFDSNTWVEKFRLDVGENITAAVAFGGGEMTISDDGTELFLSTSSGVRILDLPISTGVASRLVVSGFPIFLPAGTISTFTVTALDAAGNVADGFTGTVHFSSTDPQALLRQDYSFTPSDHGMHTFSAALLTAGTFSLTAADDADGLSGSQTNIQVHAGPLSLVPVVNHRDLVYDGSRGILYITTSDGFVQRFDVVHQTLLTPWRVGASLYGADITPDGQYLYTTEDLHVVNQGMLHKVNLNDGTHTDLTINLTGIEAGTWAVTIANNGKALFDSRFDGSGWVPLRQIDLGTDAITVRTDAPGSGPAGQVRQNTHIRRGADRSLLFLAESNISSGPIFAYNTASDSFGASAHTDFSLSTSMSAVSRDSSLIALEIINSVRIMDRSLHVLVTLPSLPSGLAFDPTRDVFYGATATQIIAYNTNTWAEISRFNIGETVPTATPFGNGEMAVSSDGHELFFSTASGVRLYQLPSSGGGAPLPMTAPMPASRVSSASRAVPQDAFVDAVGVVGVLSETIDSHGIGAGFLTTIASQGADPGGVFLPADLPLGRDLDGSSAWGSHGELGAFTEARSDSDPWAEMLGWQWVHETTV